VTARVGKALEARSKNPTMILIRVAVRVGQGVRNKGRTNPTFVYRCNIREFPNSRDTGIHFSIRTTPAFPPFKKPLLLKMCGFFLRRSSSMDFAKDIALAQLEWGGASKGPWGAPDRSCVQEIAQGVPPPPERAMGIIFAGGKRDAPRWWGQCSKNWCQNNALSLGGKIRTCCVDRGDQWGTHREIGRVAGGK